MKLRRLTLADRPLIEQYLALRPRDLSAYAFASMYIWRGLFDIRWSILEGNLCVFFQDSVGQFAYTSPLGRRIDPAAVQACFAIMDRTNGNTAVSRIENVGQEETALYEALGYACRHKADEYVCRRSSLARLAGGRFKSQRACVNFFTRHYAARYEPLAGRDVRGCLALYELWRGRSAEAHRRDPVYCGMLADSFRSLRVALADRKRLGLIARVVWVNGEIRAFTVGFKLSPDTFCVLFETADRTCKGISQFIFQRFCREMKDSTWINVMDDSGLENLRRVKLSYRPQKIVPGYIAARP